ncbi:MAG: hypothetical protein H6925_00780 [Holosporaceae bacterium]|nr:MAG: hypothetical protein H6925_00780 [Holosporaceae bacterium]
MKNSLIKFALYLCLPGLVCAATSTMRMATEDERDHRGRFYGNGFEEDHMGVYYRGSSRSDAFRERLSQKTL